MEAANIGVLLFCPERYFLKVLMNENNRRIRRFFGSEGQDWHRLNSLKKGLEERIANEAPGIRRLEDLEQFIARRANLLQITTPRPMKVSDPDLDLQNLYLEMMGEAPRGKAPKTLRQFIDEKLSGADLQHKIQRGIKVSVPVMQKQIEIPFGFQNGRFNLLNPVRFEAKNPEHSFDTACKYAVEGQSLYANPDPRLGCLQLVVIGKFQPKDSASPAIVKRVLDESHAKLFRLAEMPQLIDEIRRTGKDIVDKR